MEDFGNEKDYFYYSNNFINVIDYSKGRTRTL